MDNIVIRSVITWFLFVPIAIINGFIREKVYKPRIGDLAAHQLSTVFAILAFLTFTYVMLGDRLSEVPTLTALLIGLMWMLMTITFEFGFGYFVEHIRWEILFEDYNLLKGRVWGLMLLTILITPYIIKLVNGIE